MRFMTAFEVRSVAEPFIRRRADRHLDKGRAVILAGARAHAVNGAWTAAALLAALVLAASGCGGGEDDTPMPAASTVEATLVDRDGDGALERGPGEPLAAAIPASTLKVLRNVDHFATPEAFSFIDATLEFLGAEPG